MTHYLRVAIGIALSTAQATSEPILSSWFTDRSGAYARIFETLADESNLNAVTTWSRGQGSKNEPTYAGVHEVSASEDWVYIRTTNLASHIMGPWYLNQAKTNLFPNYPSNQAVLYRFPRNPADPLSLGSKPLTGGGPIGYFVNGVSMFDSRDAFSYSSNAGTDTQGPIAIKPGIATRTSTRALLSTLPMPIKQEGLTTTTPIRRLCGTNWETASTTFPKPISIPKTPTAGTLRSSPGRGMACPCTALMDTPIPTTRIARLFVCDPDFRYERT